MSEVQEEESGKEKSTLNGISSIVAACDPRNSILNWLLIAVPIAFYAKIAHLDESIQFISSLIGIMPLAFLMGKATEEIATRTSESIGGLLNATFGNATELIVAIAALSKGLYTLVQLSLLGSVLSNMLLVLGTGNVFVD